MKTVNKCGDRTFTVKVYQKDINKGIRFSHHGCPIAVAVKRILKKENGGVFVDGKSMRIGQFSYSLPKSARVFVTKFDKTHKVKPFEFSAEMSADYLWSPEVK